MKSPKALLSLSTLLLFCLLILLSLSSADDAAVMAKLATNLSPTPSGWTGTDYCTWTGVVCDNSNRVASINLTSLSLSGSLPSDLNQLTQLKTLALPENNLSGSLPSLANLTSLEEVFLDNNNFTSIPSDFFLGLTNLLTLSLNENPSLSPWTIPKHLTQSTSLTTFNASNANLFGSIPDFFDSFPNLQNLRLSHNNLTGPLPATFGSSGINNLSLNNQFLGLSGTIDVLSSMTQLSQVWLASNEFTGPIPNLSECLNLFDLQLQDNQFTGVMLVTLTSMCFVIRAFLA